MSYLVIKYSYGNWYAFPLTSDQSFRFAGATAEEQAVQVRNLSAAMEEGEGTLVENIGTFFSDYGGLTNEEVMTELFAATSELFYGTVPVFTAGEGATLLEEVVEAGEALAAILG